MSATVIKLVELDLKANGEVEDHCAESIYLGKLLHKHVKLVVFYDENIITHPAIFTKLFLKNRMLYPANGLLLKVGSTDELAAAIQSEYGDYMVESYNLSSNLALDIL